MKLTNGEIYLARESLSKILDLRFPVKVSFKLAKVANEVQEQLKVIDQTRNKLVRDYGKEEDNGQFRVEQNSDNWDKFMGEVTVLMDEESEIKDIPIKIPEKVASTCDSCHHNMDRALEVEPAVLMALVKFIDIG